MSKCVESWPKDSSYTRFEKCKNEATHEQYCEEHAKLHLITDVHTYTATGTAKPTKSPERTAKDRARTFAGMEKKIADLESTQRELVEALNQCEKWFGEYADIHEKKRNTEKCMVNAARCNYCREALAKIKGE
jgi:hypothetical protein